ncbi:FAD-dependent oxidoreductase [Jiangella aurantiaca]|uniref:FAD-dependent oxidoreductase n=1 Tax=Jiangella aurantiaca TaxID=2530373 RepID=A0A4R5A363_9ACTN|nr:FAD-dependent oxidoreductase [Jiangella aurantiaca]TDD66261.1 FAD-dependent oxidoreductase [Jiangella aurantiaca]
MSDLRCDVLVVGGGLGGVAAALTAAQLGATVVLTEETDWLGGQLTSQAVPPDEHPWIESRYSSPSYRRLRRKIRDYYRRNYPLREPAAADLLLNPGLGYVSPLCHEPRVAVAAIDEMLAPWRAFGRLTTLMRHRPAAVSCAGDRVEAVSFDRHADGARVNIAADYVVDATELGDLLELAGVEHVIGAEGQDETGEPHAAPHADPLDQQAISWCFPIEHRAGENHLTDKPVGYDDWHTTVAPFWPGPQLSWTDVEPISLARRDRFIFDSVRENGARDLWRYRRILASHLFDHHGGADGAMAGPVDPAEIGESDITLVNWPQIDYWELPLLGVDAQTRERALDRARDLSLSFLYWMQTEAPRVDGGHGYPGLRLRPDVVDTADGLAKMPYVREARRIKAEFTVVEQHVGVDARGGLAGSEVFDDSVGIGSYRIDLHPSTAGRTYVDVDCYPFQIPLGALLPVRVENLLPAAKNVGTTHITNGCYRLHPVEWSIGEAVGALVAESLTRGVPPRAVRADRRRLADFQHRLTAGLGVPLAWPNEIRTTSCGRHPARPQLIDATST